MTLARELLICAVLVGGAGIASAQTLTYGPIVGRAATPDQLIIKWGTDASTGTAALSFRPLSTGDFAPVSGAESKNDAGSFDHAATLTGLSLATVYEYRVEGVTQPQTHRVSTCPQPGAPMDVVFYGDSRDQPLSSAGQTEHVKIVGRVLALGPDMVFDSGDLVYTGSYSDYLSQLFPVIGPMASSVPFMAVPGNHDSGDPLDLNAGGMSVLSAAFERLFPSPQPEGSTWQPYYSFRCGNAMFIGLDSESLVANGDATQTTFLNAQLANAASDASLDHVLVWFHHAPYSPGSGLLAHGDNATVQQAWVPLFDAPANKVSAVFTGHDHLYARMSNGSHVSYVVSGAAGAGTTAVDGTSKAMKLAAKSAFGFVLVHLAGKMLTGTAYDDTGAPFNQWTQTSTNMTTPTPDGGVPASSGATAGGTTASAPPNGLADGHGGCSIVGMRQGGDAMVVALALALFLAARRRRAAHGWRDRHSPLSTGRR